MFGLFKKKTEVEKLQSKYEALMKEWHSLSTINRSASDDKYAEAQKIAEQINQLKNEVA
ncbi:Lacal_2735 family protein [Algibacter sp. R77976]|uniref:Lacal_2735 family protein n=1 Tax=Algibacter sp. R77976 TaxID=3093873 RepID=UPI0037C7818E